MATTTANRKTEDGRIIDDIPEMTIEEALEVSDMALADFLEDERRVKEDACLEDKKNFKELQRKLSEAASRPKAAKITEKRSPAEVWPEHVEEIRKVKDGLDYEEKVDKAGNSRRRYYFTYDNLVYAICHDPMMKSALPMLNEFSDQVVKSGRFLWEMDDHDGGADATGYDRYKPRDLINIARRLQKVYGFAAANARSVNEALQAGAEEHRFNPVKDMYRQSWEKWKDAGSPAGYMEEIFIDWLGVEDDAAGYAREVSRLFLLAAIERTYNPGASYPFMPILAGREQGTGKSTLLKYLARHDYYNNDDLTKEDNESVYVSANCLINEVEEGEILYTKNRQRLKRFITSDKDILRKKFDAIETEVKRHTVYIITTNDGVAGLLTDPTGARRFPILEVRADHRRYKINKEMNNKFIEDYIDMVWGEAYDFWLKNHKKWQTLDMSEKAKEYMKKVQEKYSWHDDLEIEIRRFLYEGAHGKTMQKVCAKHLWVECMGGDISRAMPQKDRARIERAMETMKNDDGETWERATKIERYNETGYALNQRIVWHRPRSEKAWDPLEDVLSDSLS